MPIGGMRKPAAARSVKAFGIARIKEAKSGPYALGVRCRHTDEGRNDNAENRPAGERPALVALSWQARRC